MGLSVCLIVKNEEEVLFRCLSCVKKFADEIIIADTGSSDKSVEIAKKFTDNVFFFEWRDDFSAARNFAFEKATREYVMWLDADDVITDENCRKIREFTAAGGFDIAYLPYAAAFDGDKPTFVYYRERIMRRDMNFRFEGEVHEAVTPRGRAVYLDAPVYHKKLKRGDPMRNLNILQRKIARGEKLDMRQKFYYGRELLDCGMTAEGCAVLEEVTEGGGWVENRLEGCVNLYFAYLSLGREREATAALLKTFLIAKPRSDVCCILGGRALDGGDLNSAAFWYELALKCVPDARGGGFVNLDWCGYIPHIQLCVIYDRLGDTRLAAYHNEEAGKIKPRSEAFLGNRRYFENKLN